ncbi:hypothetical protein [Streptomyces sp. NBC_01235]|uniref:hypothetical protein n=1 Tax=Streptomyces sp. NBC_01235 TaxID=2903788 RepID=UPI002E0DE30B|nr:hypothetical protein OG289_21495 [Streptomyces sp. NBC_01235]
MTTSAAHPRFAEALLTLGLDGLPTRSFPMAPKDLVEHADATLVDVREPTA